MSPQSLTRSSARHPRIVIAVWTIALVISIAASGILWGQGLTAQRAILVETESNTADRLLEERFRGPRRVTEIVLVSSDSYTIVDPRFEATVQNLFFDLAALVPGVVAGVSQYYHSGSEYQVSASGHSTIMSVTMAGTLDEARANVSSVIDVTHKHRGSEDFTVLVVGEASIADRVSGLSNPALQGLVILLAILVPLIVSQPVRASRLPIIIGLVSAAISVGISALVELVLPMSLFNYTVTLVVGLAVGMSITNIVASRFREERTQGLNPLESIAAIGVTTTRFILLGGLFALVAVGSIAIIPVNTLASIAVGAALATLVVLLTSLTLTPALLSGGNDWISGLQPPCPDDPDAPSSPGRHQFGLGAMGKLVTEKVLRLPTVFAITATLVLIALTSLVFQIDLGFTDVESFPDGQEGGAYGSQVKRAYDRLIEDFPAGVISPVEIVIDAPFKHPDIEPRVAELQAALATDPGFVGESRIQNNQDHDMVLITVPTRDSPESRAAREAVQRLRSEHIPEIFSGTGVDVLVTGGPALAADYMKVVELYAPYAIVVVVLLSAITLLIGTRSLLIPVLATLAHLLSFGAAYGVMVITLQHGIGAGSGLLRYHHTPTIEFWGLIFAVVLMIGILAFIDLSMFARIRERYSDTEERGNAGTLGSWSSSWVCTGASLAAAAVFFLLALSDLPVFHQVGFALTLAFLIDAVVVRPILFPSILKLLGPAVWYFPGFLKRLPDLGSR